MFSLNKQKHENPLPTPWGVFYPGREADLSKVPMETRNRWIESEDFIQNDNAPDLYEDMPLDALSGMDRTALKQFIVDNMIPVRVKEKWKDEEIRQAIRELVPADALAALLVPPVKVEAPVVAPPSTSPSA